MKKSILALTSMATLLLSTVACNEIAPGDRLVEVKHKVSADARPMLIEKYTGVNCVNCPGASEILHETTKDMLDGKAIIVAIHGYNAFTPESNDLFSTDGQAYFNEIVNAPGLPTALFNRTMAEGKSVRYSTSPSEWSKLIYQGLAQKQIFRANLSAQYVSNRLEVNYQANQISTGNTPKIKLQLWLLEDGIVAPQLSKEKGRIKGYVHDHVLRKALNGTWGKDYNVGDKVQLKEIEVAGNIKQANTSVVAFLYDSDSKEVLDVVKCDL